VVGTETVKRSVIEKWSQTLTGSAHSLGSQSKTTFRYSRCPKRKERFGATSCDCYLYHQGTARACKFSSSSVYQQHTRTVELGKNTTAKVAGPKRKANTSDFQKTRVSDMSAVVRCGVLFWRLLAVAPDGSSGTVPLQRPDAGWYMQSVMPVL
jgi:hypothetical protein